MVWHLGSRLITSHAMMNRSRKIIASAAPSGIPLAAAMGIVTGAFIAAIFHWSHDHSGYTPVELAEHFVPQLLTFATLFALLFVTVATGRNQHRTKKLSKTPPSYGQGLR